MKIYADEYSREVIDRELSIEYDTKESAESRARELGNRWQAMRSCKTKGKWQLGHTIGAAF